MDVLEPMQSVDLDHDGRRVGVEELIVDAEDKLVVPRRVVVAVGVDAGGEFPVGVDPGDGVGSHGAGDGGEILGGDHIELKKLEGVENRHGGGGGEIGISGGGEGGERGDRQDGAGQGEGGEGRRGMGEALSENRWGCEKDGHLFVLLVGENGELGKKNKEWRICFHWFNIFSGKFQRSFFFHPAKHSPGISYI